MQIEKLSCAIGKREILHDVSFTLNKGRITVLLGKNGCGKTTLLRTLTGLLSYKSGRIIIDDKDYSLLKEKELSRMISYLPQNLPSPAITVRELLELARYPYTSFGRKLTEEDGKLIDDALIKTGKKDMENHLVCHLSGGEKTMAYIAMVLAKDSPYCIMDEPYASLDLPSHQKLTELLMELKKENRTVLLSVHDLLLALTVADDILLLDQGKLVFSGTKEEFLESDSCSSVFGYQIVEAKDEDGNVYPVLKKNV